MSTADELVSPVTTERPILTLTSASINTEPVELESTPISPDKVKAMPRTSRDDLLRDMSPEDVEKRDALLKERKSDPAVMVDIPQTPGAEELEKSGATAVEDGAVAAQLNVQVAAV
ncbi:hypothetical protein B0A48_14460 [Cryoendolithus antarcticus]|uniref:Uncharacterized protein n=1 Tax=Cryoendolithus antarcticus TaxID=1507870 RepID=A0A1V8SK15_9PEZI|nr:hypothetical protein B0A48_14460 [Cryoendolithus antarcticus]